MKSSVLESTWLRYLSVAVSTLIALVLSAVFWSVVQDAPFIFFFAAVAFSAWYGGLWPGMLATLASLILADYFLIAPLHAFSTRPTEVVLFLVFTLVSLLISWTENHRRQSEAAYRTVRDELQVILNGVVDGVLAQDKDGHVIFANPAASQILGFDSSQDLVNKPVDGIHSQYEMLNEQNEVIPYTNLPRQRVFADGKPARGVILLRYLKSGEERWLDLRSAPVFDQKGNVRLTVTLMRDATERRKIDTRLREERERLFTVVNSIGDGIIATDNEGYIQMMNPAAEQLLGRQAQVSLGQPIDEVFHLVSEETDQPLPNPLSSTLSHEIKPRWQNHALLLGGEGRRVPVEYRAVPMKHDHDEHFGKLLVFRDILDRLQIEKQRQRTEEHLRRILDTLPILVWVMTPDGMLVEANRTALNTADLAPVDVLNRPFEDTYWWSYSEASKARLREAISRARAGESVRYDVDIRVAQDTYMTIDFMISPMYDLDGNISYLVPAALDVTDRKRSEQELLRLTMISEIQRQRLNDIITNVPGIVFEGSGTAKDSTLQTDYISEYAETLLGYPVEAWLNNPQFWSKIVHPDDLTPLGERLMSIYESGKPGTFPFRAVTSNGHVLHMEAHLTFLKDAEERHFGACGVIMDVTQRKEIEGALMQFTDELRRSNEELEQFAYIASHDLQEPLRMVTSYLQLLEKRYGDVLEGDGKEFLGFAVDGATRMKRLINDLLLYSRVQRSREEFETVNMQKVLEQAENNVQTQIMDSGTAITTDVLPEIIGHEAQMIQLLQNLLSNAIKFRSDQPPQIHIGAKREKGEWIFSIQDNGIGIGQEYLDRIFVIFQRLHPREEYPGTGIGLAICKKIVEKHNGHIWVESEIGKGTTFYFTIPVKHRGRRRLNGGN